MNGGSISGQATHPREQSNIQPPFQGLSSSDKPIAIPNRWWCLRSIFFRHFRAKLVADVLLGR